MKNANHISAAIIGGGAAGLMAGCMLARAGIPAVILEKQPRVGRKLLSTGNGRCNFTNMNASLRDYHGSARHIRAALEAFTPQDAIDFFGSIGVPASIDEEGRAYPLSNMAAGVLDALRLYAAENGCELRTEFEVKAISRRGNAYLVEAASGETCLAENVIVACGGLAAPKLGACGDGYRLLEAFGHKTAARLPAISAIKTAPEQVRALKGIRAACEIALTSEGRCIRRETGEILFNETGVSGIAAMQLAREANLILKKSGKCALEINFLPGMPQNFIEKRTHILPRRPLDDFLCGVLPKRLAQVLMKAAGVGPLNLPAEALSPAQQHSLMRILTGWTLAVRGTQSFDNAQVTCGGTSLDGFDPDTLESMRAPGLFAAGEVLDVDGDCGGFNLHWAWASAALCCREIARRHTSSR